MQLPITGIHHISAIAGDPQTNLDFYISVLGLRLVKRTVNFDDPDTHHFYYGDHTGQPGTIMSFFPMPGAPRGQTGAGQCTSTALSIPANAIDFWLDRFNVHGVPYSLAPERFGEMVITFSDPDGLALELVATNSAPEITYWADSSVPAEHAICGFHSATLIEDEHDPTDHMLRAVLGFTLSGQDDQRFRYTVAGGGAGRMLDVLIDSQAEKGRVAVGCVHHIAWRTPNDSTQATMRSNIDDMGYNITHVMDRKYFRAVYFREPGGFLFEIATDPPGFTTDESAAMLGTATSLPTWLENRRNQIEAALPPIELPVLK